MTKPKIILAITGASGAIYAERLLLKFNELTNQIENVAYIFTKNAQDIWKEEISEFTPSQILCKQYSNNDFSAPFASGSTKWDTMIICPCSMGVLGRIANGTSNDLITRAADVILKERRKLILVVRETPYSLIHIQNMEKVTLAGGIICPATPSFYNKPKSINELVDTVINRILDLAGLETSSFRWNEEK